MSIIKDNKIYKKTSFLSGINSDFIEKYYEDYISNPGKIPIEWKTFFDGLNEETDNIHKNISGPSWSPQKQKTDKQKVITDIINDKNLPNELTDDFKQSAKDSVRAIMLIRAYRIRGHLIADLDPLSLQEKKDHPELKP